MMDFVCKWKGAMKMEREVQFYTGPGLRLAGVLHAPPDYEEGGGRRPGVVLCHGFMGVKELILPDIARWLVREGYVVLRFDYRGFGDSEGPECRLIPLEQVEDIRNAITFMEQQPEVDPRRIGLFGPSFGGANVSYTAGVDPRAKCVVSVVGIGDGGRWLRSLRRGWEWQEFLRQLAADRVARVLTGKSRYVDRDEVMVPDPDTQKAHEEHKKGLPGIKTSLPLESAEAIIDYRPESVVDRISPRAALWIHAGADNLVPADESRRMYEKAGEPRKLAILEGEPHYAVYSGPGFQRTMTLATEWFDTYLRTA